MKWDATTYDDKHSFVTTCGLGVLQLLAPQKGERILDVGCGTGHLTNRIAQAGAISLGLDSSVEMITVARRTYPDIHFEVGDIRDFTSKVQYDAIFSNAALHWVRPPEVAVARMSQVLRPGGRFVVEFGGFGNVRRICEALEKSVRKVTGQTIPVSNYFPKLSEYTTILEQNGFEVSLARHFDRPTRLEGGDQGLAQWLQLFRKPIIEALGESDRAQVLREVQSELRSELFCEGAWFADYRRLQIEARKFSAPN